MLQLPVDFRRHSSAACYGTRNTRDNDVTPTTERSRSPSWCATTNTQTFRRRSFSVTPKGGLVNEGDVVLPSPTTDDAGSRRSSYNSTAENSGSATGSSVDTPPVYRVLMIGGPGVGKTALTQQFMTSEFMAAQNTSFGQLDILCCSTQSSSGVARNLRQEVRKVVLLPPLPSPLFSLPFLPFPSLSLEVGTLKYSCRVLKSDIWWHQFYDRARAGFT